MQVRRVAFYNAIPVHKFSFRPLWIMKNDDDVWAGMDKYQRHDYAKDAKNYGELPFKDKQDPSNGWAGPFVTGHKYRLKWGTKGINWE